MSNYNYTVKCFFCVQSGKNYTGQKKFTRAAPVAPVTIMRYAEIHFAFVQIQIYTNTLYICTNTLYICTNTIYICMMIILIMILIILMRRVLQTVARVKIVYSSTLLSSSINTMAIFQQIQHGYEYEYK